ncbi:NAD kinase 2, chloroplastic [Balamuthia mandrillaris]
MEEPAATSAMKQRSMALGAYGLTWREPPTSVLLVHNRHSPHLLDPLREIAEWLVQEKKMNVYVKPRTHKLFPHLLCFERKSQQPEIDLVICLGGDGTVLHTISLFQDRVPPTMCFNLGSLGFLTPFEFGEGTKQEIERVLEGKSCAILRMRLVCSIFRRGSSIPESRVRVLNEVVITRGNSPYLTNLECYCDGSSITTVQADGIIVATATGSTAYSLSAGGPLLHPSIPAILFTPICPHSLSFRPVILPATANLSIQVPPDSRSSAMVQFDGKKNVELAQGDTVSISMSYYPAPAITPTSQTHHWFRQLANKLGWNVRMRQEGLNTDTQQTPFYTSGININGNDGGKNGQQRLRLSSAWKERMVPLAERSQL